MRIHIFIPVIAAALLSGVPRDLRISSPGVARAEEDDPEVTAMARQHFKLGQEAYAQGKYELAIKELKKAYLLKRFPAILLNIALTYRKMRDYDMSSYFYKKFLTEAPADDKQRPMAETGMRELEAEKAAAMAPPEQPRPQAVEAVPKARPTPPAAAPAPPAAAPAAPKAEEPQPAASEWTHNPIYEVPPGQPVDVRVQMPVMKGIKVRVFFRKEGQASFDSLELKRKGNEKIARIPAATTAGRTFQYYIEARDPAGTLVKSSGSEASPNIVLIEKGARPQLAGAEVPEGADEDEAGKKGKGFSRDIENEAVTFDPKAAQRRAMERLRDQLKGESEGKPGRSRLGMLGWVGVGLLAGGGAALVGGSVALGFAKRWADSVNADARCMGANHQVKVNGVAQCAHFGPNPDEGWSRALPSPTSADYDAQGRLFDSLGIGFTAGGGALLAAGGALLAYDMITRQMKERAQAQAERPVQPAQPGTGKKKRKVRKVIEVEEEARLRIGPSLSPAGVGLFAVVRF